jgi:hypothetical protein
MSGPFAAALKEIERLWNVATPGTGKNRTTYDSFNDLLAPHGSMT